MSERVWEPDAETPSERGVEYIAVEPGRDELDSPCLEWITIDHPDDVYMLREADEVLDTYFNPEFDAWETLVLVNPVAESDD